jgi:hypothetical protein
MVADLDFDLGLNIATAHCVKEFRIDYTDKE